MTVSIKDFILDDLTVLEDRAEMTFAQFKTPFILRSIGTDEFNKIRKEATRKIPNRKTGVTAIETDEDKLLDLMIEAAVVQPNLRDNDLQEAYGTTGNAAATARKMLKLGQYNELIEKIQELAGFDFDGATEQVKN